MSAQENGGPAFPVQEWNADGTPATLSLGMTMRDYFAAQALVGWRESLGTLKEDAEIAYQMADAMIEARKS